MIRHLFSLTLATPLLLMTMTAAAEGRWYAGASVGAGEANELAFSDIDDGSALSGSFDDQDFGWKIFGGYSYNEYVAIEAAYADLGEVSLDAQSDGNGSIFAPGPVVATIDASGFSLTVLGFMPVTERFDFFAKIGYFTWESTTSLSNSAIGNLSSDDDGADPVFGVGARFEFNERLTLRGEYEIFTDIDDEDGALFSLGLSVGF